MLLYNDADGAKAHAHRAHTAHAAVVALHALCCGAPAALFLFSASAMAGALGGMVTQAHHFLHGHELWLIALSAALIVGGAVAEWRARQAGARRFPALFVLSVACLAANIAIVAAHRL